MRRIAYFYAADSGSFHYGAGHPMKPHRVAVTHSIVFAYGLQKYMDVFAIRPATKVEMQEYHTEEYINMLSQDYLEMPCDRVTEDCPSFEGMGEMCALYSGGSLQAARAINEKQYDICINWAGGLHHAKKAEPSGFCYANDIVLAIQELLKKHRRVMYIDIDIHHGDGVEEAFYHTDRVMTVSFHKYGDRYFPGTGNICCTGRGKGKGASVNVPLDFGIDDESYHYVFKHVVKMCVDSFVPEAIVMQCGSDSLAADRIGCFGLSIKGHGECVRFVRDLKIPLLVLGGGGYKPKHVSRCWAYETSILCNVDVPNAIPKNPHSDYLGENAVLHIDLQCEYTNKNVRDNLDRIISIVHEILTER
ncbi:histone deacetylase 1/2 [Nematocida major]|uniref:histone deacetylase 1/2 n=1 Tax=Nematocida major TaxID=1912982 RepID=UPI00200738C6|nr:histone deacetylase 1/2 [Nematocida major]KAH9387071.1 histone deacetylase 1/2 [Nematocida major]